MQWYIQSFFGQTGTYIKSKKAPPRLAQSGKFSSKFVPPDALKMHSLFVLQFPCKTVSKLLKFTLQNTLLCGWLLKKSIYLNKNLYGYKLIRAVKQSQLKDEATGLDERDMQLYFHVPTHTILNLICKVWARYKLSINTSALIICTEVKYYPDLSKFIWVMNTSIR